MTDVLTLSQSETGAYSVRQFDLGCLLPEALANWLTEHQPHPVFATPQWFYQLTRFEKTIKRRCRSEFYWLILFNDNLPVLAAPIEQYRNKLGQLKLRLLSNFYTPVIDLFYNRTQFTSDEAWQMLTRAISQHIPQWVSLQISPLQAPQLDTLSQLPAEQVFVFPYHFSANYSSQFCSATQYWQGRPSKLKNTLLRKNKLLKKQAYQFELVTEPTGEQIAQYWQIYHHSWKIPEPSDSFINWLIGATAQSGQLRLGFLYIEQQIVACQLWLIKDRTAYIFKLAQLQDMNQYSPGSLLTEYLINTLITRDNLNQIDFLLGDDTFKQLWMEQRQPIYGAELLNQRHPAGRWIRAFYISKQWLKKHFRQRSDKIVHNPAANRSIF